MTVASRNNCWARVVLDSVGPNGQRLTSMEVRYWRSIHAEFMTHRACARNAASSRAIPFLRLSKQPVRLAEMPPGAIPVGKPPVGEISLDSSELYSYIVANCTYSYLHNDPFLPEFIGSEQKGMQSGDELQEPNRIQALEGIERMRQFCLQECRRLHDLGVHKSIINRYLEPWSYITVLVTATEWKNFFRLRIHPKAEKHFNKVAGLMKQALDASTPQPLKHGEWHMPYLREEERALLRDPYAVDVAAALGVPSVEVLGRDVNSYFKRISAARCARLSYLTHDGACNPADDLRIFNSLIHPKTDDGRDDDTIHASPLEHVATPDLDPELRSGPFRGWLQFRKEFPNENVVG